MNWRLGCPVLIALGCVVIGLVALMDRVINDDISLEAYYATHADAVVDGAITRGWIPEYMPHSATNIQESHSTQTNEQWMRFDCDPTDRPAMISQLTPVAVEDAQFPWPRYTQKREWWPEALREASPETTALYDLHTDGEETYVAIEKERPRVWLWQI